MSSDSTKGWNSAGTSSSEGAAYDAELGLKYMPQELARIIEPVLRALGETRDHSIVAAARGLVKTIVQLILQLSESDFEIRNLPPLQGANLDDGSFLMEWLSLNYRAGFVIDPDRGESIWYLIVKDESSNSNRYGSLHSREGEEAIAGLVSYVASNS